MIKENRFFAYALAATATLMTFLVLSYFAQGQKAILTGLTVAIIFFEVTAPFEILKRLGINPRDCNIYAYHIDTTLDLMLPPFKYHRQSPDFVGLRRELMWFMLFTVAIFVPYTLGYWGYQELLAVRSNVQLVFSFNVPPQLFYEIITQIFVVAVPEEIFYRGFLQSAMLRRLAPHGRPARWAIVTAVILTNLVFAVGHVASTMHATRLLTFFPGLLFSMLVLRHKSLLSAILFHAACNILGQILYASFYLQ